MKVAVIFTGLVRPQKNLYDHSIETMKSLFPNADFFYTTWKGYEEYDWMTSYYEEPKIKYFADYQIFKANIKQMREINNPSDLKYKALRNRIRDRKKARNLIKQHLGYALAFEEHVTNHDIAIRVRYDLKFSDDITFEDMDQACDLVYGSERPIGIGALHPDIIKPGQLTLCDKTIPTIGDFMIIHRADRFDPVHVWGLYEDKKLLSGEGGWWQIMAEPYHKEVYNGSHMWCKI